MSSPVSLSRIGTTVRVLTSVPQGITELEYRIESGLNRVISKYTDVSQYDPNHGKPYPRQAGEVGRELFFPVVDVAIEPGMQAIAEFEGNCSGTWIMNSIFYKKKQPLSSSVCVDAQFLQDWENTIYVESNPLPEMTRFYLRKRVPVIPCSTKEFALDFSVFRDYWYGTVSVYGVAENGTTSMIGSAELPPVRQLDTRPPAELQRASTGATRLTPKLVTESLKTTIGFILRCQIQSPWSPLRGGLNMLYDLDTGFYRLPHWMWVWGASINLLLQASSIPAVCAVYGAESLKQAAVGIGDALVRFQIRNPAHPADGLIMAEWVPRLFVPTAIVNTGNVEEIDISDALFNVGWGLVPLYQATGDVRYLEVSKQVALATGRIIDQFDLVPQHWLVDANDWSDHTIDEAGFGIKGLAALSIATGDPVFKEITRKYTEQFFDKMILPDGLWEKIWHRSTGKAGQRRFDTRSLGWSMEGLLSAHSAIPKEPKYLQYAEKLAAHLVQSQQPKGFWYFTFADAASGIGEKGTALWSMLLYRLYGYTRRPEYLEAARKALSWCIGNQYGGPDPEPIGALISCNRGSGICYRYWFRMACSYASAFMGHALLGELAQQQVGQG